MGDDYEDDGLAPFPEDVKPLGIMLIVLAVVFGGIILIEVLT